MTLYVILLHRPSAPVTPVWGIQKVIRMPAEGFFRREAVGALSFDFSTEKFMFKRTWQVVFWGTRNDSGVPKQLAARLKAREGLHSEVVAPESKKTGAKMNKWTAFYIQTASLKTVTVEKGNGFYSCFQSTANRIFSSFGIVLQDLFSVAVPPFTMSKYPVWRNASLSLTPRAVMTITGMVREFPIFEFRNKVSKSKPLVPGI